MVSNSRQFKFLKSSRNLNVKSSAKREYRDENVFLKGDIALSKLITLLIHICRSAKRDDHIYRSAERVDHQVACPRRAHSCERSEQIF